MIRPHLPGVACVLAGAPTRRVPSRARIRFWNWTASSGTGRRRRRSAAGQQVSRDAGKRRGSRPIRIGISGHAGVIARRLDQKAASTSGTRTNTRRPPRREDDSSSADGRAGQRARVAPSIACRSPAPVARASLRCPKLRWTSGERCAYDHFIRAHPGPPVLASSLPPCCVAPPSPHALFAPYTLPVAPRSGDTG